MSYNKYWEDIIKIIDNRKQEMIGSDFENRNSIYQTCPFCKLPYAYNEITSHVEKRHPDSFLVECNDQHLKLGDKSEVKDLYHLSVACDPKKYKKITIEIDRENLITKKTIKGKFDYPLDKEIKQQPFSEIRIKYNNEKIVIRKKLDTAVFNNFNLQNSKISTPYIFQLAENDYLDVKTAYYGAQIIRKNKDARLLDEYYDCLTDYDFERGEDRNNLYLFYYLAKESENLKYNGYVHFDDVIWNALRKILYGDFEGAYQDLDGYKRCNEKIGLLAILDLLTNNRPEYRKIISKYERKGFINDLLVVIEMLAFTKDEYDYERKAKIKSSFETIKLHYNYPLISSLCRLDDSITKRLSISQEQYEMLYRLSPYVTIAYIRADDSGSEKLINRAINLFPDYKRLFSQVRQNDNKGNVGKYLSKYSREYLNQFPFDSSVTITNKGYLGCNEILINFGKESILINCGNQIEFENDHFDYMVLTEYSNKCVGMISSSIFNQILETNIYTNKEVLELIDKERFSNVHGYEWNESVNLSNDLEINMIPSCSNLTSSILQIVYRDKIILYVDDFKYNSIFGKLQVELLPKEVDYLIIGCNNLKQDKYYYSSLKSLLIDHSNENLVFELDDYSDVMELFIELVSNLNDLKDYDIYLSDSTMKYLNMVMESTEDYKIYKADENIEIGDHQIIIYSLLDTSIKYENHYQNYISHNNNKNTFMLENKASKAEIKNLIGYLKPKVLSILNNEQTEEIKQYYVESISKDIVIKDLSDGLVVHPFDLNEEENV